MSIHGRCPLCAVVVDEHGCPEHERFPREPDARSEEEKLIALWRHFKDLLARGVLSDGVCLELFPDGSGCFSHTERLESGSILEVEHGAFADFNGGISSDKHYTEWRRMTSYMRETTTAGKLCEELHKWRRAKEVPEPSHIIVWEEGQNLTVWGEDRSTPFVFKGNPAADDFGTAVVLLRTWAEGR